MTLSVIVPVYNGAAHLRRCLEALAASSRAPDEVIVVDDSSDDDSADIATACGARVIALIGGPRGPAAARNRAADAACGDVLVFVDADVAVHTDTLSRMEQYFTDCPDVEALFGSYDDAPPAQGLVTRYKNLLHHYVHQHAGRDASTFWAGCGAVRRSLFCDAGGFDECYTSPSVEDIELGMRLRRAGHHIRLCPDVQATHLKQWTVGAWLRTDIFSRAVPWTRLIVANASLPNDLNIDVKSRVGALAAWGLVFFPALGFWSPWAWLGLLPALATLAACNAGLLRFFRERGGDRFVAGAAGLHTLYLLYSSLTYAAIAGPAKLARYGLALLLVTTLLKGLAWSILLPPWQAPDEPQQFLYGQYVERLGTVHVPPGVQISQEVWEFAQAAQIDAVRFHAGRPLDVSDRAQIAGTLSDLRLTYVKRSYVADPYLQVLTQPNFYRYHPPLYYAALAAIQKPLESRSLPMRLLACRWFSVLLGLVIVLLSYAAGRVLWPDRPARSLLLASLVSFHPMVTFTTSTVTNGALEIGLFSSFLYISLRILRQGMTGRRALALGLLTGLGLLTKMSFLSVVPLLGGLLLWDITRLQRESRLGPHTLFPWIGIILLPAVLSGWWYHAAIRSGGASLVTSYGKISGQLHTHPSAYLMTFPWIRVYSRVLASYWSAFGWGGDARFPTSMLILLSALSGIVIWNTGRRLVRHRGVSSQEGYGAKSSVLFLGVATLCFVFFYIGIDYRIAQQLGGHFGLRGQYYLPPIIGQMTWLILGLELSVAERLRRGWFWLLGGGMIALNGYALFGIVLPRYYGAHPLRELIDLATVLQPINHAAAFSLCVLFLMFSSALLVALGGLFFAQDPRRPSDDGFIRGLPL